MAVSFLGNESLMALEKVSFLSSRSITPDAVMNSHSWATKIRETDTCVIGGFHSDLEKDVLKFLLRGKCPIVIVEARSPRKRIPATLKVAFDAGRILFVSIGDGNMKRTSVADAIRCNKFVLENAKSHVFGSLDATGNLSKLVKGMSKDDVHVLG